MLRGPFDDWDSARMATLIALREMASDLEAQEQEAWLAVNEPHGC